MSKTARCPGVGSPATNVSRGWVGNRLPVMGECGTCGGRVEITRKWTVKYHTLRLAPVSAHEGSEQR